METITFNVRRFDGERIWNQEYVLDKRVDTLLGYLTRIKEELDPTFSYTAACRHAICGSCAVQVNGNAYLACKTQVDDLLDTFKTDTLFLEPLNNFPVVRDLVVSFDEFGEKLKKIDGWLVEDPKREDHLQSQEDFNLIAQPADCIMCGCCASECREMAYDNDETYLPPAIMNRGYRFERDSRDGEKGKRVLCALENNLWKCIHCQQCTTKCPKHIPVAEEISYLRRRAIAMGETKSMGARHAMCFYHDTRTTGILNEAMLAMKTEGMVKCMKNRIPFTVRMVTSGKMNPLHIQKPVKGIEDVRRLFEYAEKMEKEA